MDDKTDLARRMMETARAGDSRNESHLLRCASVSVLPNGTCVSSAICTANKFPHTVGRKAEFLWKLHVDRSFRQTIKVCFTDVYETQLETLSCALSLLGEPGKDQLLRLKGRSGGNETVVLAILVDLARDESTSDVWSGRVTFVTAYPAGSHKDMSIDFVHVILLLGFPNSIVEVIEFFHDGCMGQLGVESFASVLIHILGAELI